MRLSIRRPTFFNVVMPSSGVSIRDLRLSCKSLSIVTKRKESQLMEMQVHYAIAFGFLQAVCLKVARNKSQRVAIPIGEAPHPVSN
jgi:hypothetical protein